MELKIPYGRTHLKFEIPDKRLEAVLKPKLCEIEPELKQVEIVKRALENPIESSRLTELARGKEKILIITSDHTRPVPSKITMPLLLEKIRDGNPNADITILLATGLHRPTTEEEKIDKFGERMAKTKKIVCHESPQAITEKIMKTLREQTLPDQREAQVLARVLDRAAVIIVTDKCPPELITNMHMQHAFTVEEAIKKAEVIVGKNSDIVVIPNSVAVIVC